MFKCGDLISIWPTTKHNTINKAGANSSRVVREPLPAEEMAAQRGDSELL
jgi:hypothetical protein